MAISNNPFRHSSYLLSAHDDSQFPEDSGHEVAFVGRSNVGKSTVINTVTGQKNLARTSKTPGRTRQINFFEVQPGVRLVDLPGYGFARVDAATRKQWDKVVNSYLTERRSLSALILITDIRRPLSREDMQLIKWCNSVDIPVRIVVNKADKLGRHKQNLALAALRRELGALPVSVQLFSGADKTGLTELLEALSVWLYPKKQGPGH